MDRVFSVGDISDQFWSPPPIAEEESSSSSASKTMNRSASEWAFQRFLQEASASESSSSKPVVESNKDDIVEIKNNDNPNPPRINNTASFAAGPPPNVPIDSDEYQAFLKSRLNLACAAVALTRASSAKPQDFTALPDNGSQASDTSQLGSQVHPRVSGHDLSKREYKDDGGPLGSPSLPGLQKKPAVQVKSTSGSSRDLSDDDELDGETETTQNMDPADSKRVRRMLSNRESARRSRRRKQAHLTELETQVSQLRVENSTLLKRLSDISHKHTEAAVDNRVLKADIETMRAKVKFAEEAVKRATGMNPFLQAMSEISTLGIPSFGGSPSDTSGDAAVPIQDDPNRHFYQPASDNHVCIPPVDNALQNPATAPVQGNRMERTASMQRVASLEHLQKRIRGDISSCGTQSCGEKL